MKKNLKFLTQLTLTAALVLGTSFAALGATNNTVPKTTIVQESNTSNVTEPKKCGKYSTWVYDKDTKTLTISGTGKVQESTDWHQLDFKYVVINNGITNIANYTFQDYVSIENVSIPNSVKRIGNRAFGHTSLKSITIGKNVEKLGYNVFENCKKLTSVSWNAEKVPYNAFYRCTNLTTVKLGNNVCRIESYAFQKTAIKNLVVPNSVETIEHHAFAYCRSLENLKLSKNIDNLPSSFIYDCDSLTEIKFPKNLEKISNYAFNGSPIEKLTIPNSVNTLGKRAFFGARYLKEVKLPNSIKTIRDELFSDCKKLEKVTIGKKVTYIGESAFANCKNLKDIVIPSNVKVIGYGAFQNSGIETVVIKNGLKKLDFWAFYDCDKLKSINIPESVVVIQENALSDCGKLTNILVDANNASYASVNGCLTNKSKTKLYTVPAGKTGTFEIPSTITKIVSSAFNGCSKITRFSATSNSYFTSSDGILYNNSMKTLIKCPVKKTGTIKIPSTVTKIEESAFSQSKASSIIIPNSVKTIGYCAFEYCNNLKTIKIPESVKTISNSSFWGCKKLRKVTIEKGVKTIGRNAFHDCESLRKVILPTSVSKIGKSSFSGCYNVTFYCKKSSYAMSYAVSRWAINYKLI